MTRSKLKVILDTNVALGVWFFQGIAPTLAQTPAQTPAFLALIAESELYACEPMYAEALRVAQSRHLAKYNLDGQALVQLQTHWAQHIIQIELGAAKSPLKCIDRDDQVFLDLAAQVQADIVFSLDHDLLRLQKKAATIGLMICRPDSKPLSWPKVQSEAG